MHVLFVCTVCVSFFFFFFLYGGQCIAHCEEVSVLYVHVPLCVVQYG